MRLVFHTSSTLTSFQGILPLQMSGELDCFRSATARHPCEDGGSVDFLSVTRGYFVADEKSL